MGPAGALVIGALGGVVCLGAQRALRRALKLDDALDVVAVHLVGGSLGSMLAGVFASSALGVFSGEADIAILDQLRVQAVGVVSAVLYTVAVTWAILKLVNTLVREGIAEEALDKGLDPLAHDERGYVYTSRVRSTPDTDA